jgi:heterodisulfide reductase subunit A
VRVELTDETSRVVERAHDLVVLSVGMLPGDNLGPIYGVLPAQDGFATIPDPNLSPTVSERPGLFVTGTAAGPMDIVDSIVLAGAAAAQAAAYLETVFTGASTRRTVEPEVAHA